MLDHLTGRGSTLGKPNFMEFNEVIALQYEKYIFRISYLTMDKEKKFERFQFCCRLTYRVKCQMYTVG